MNFLIRGMAIHAIRGVAIGLPSGLILGILWRLPSIPVGIAFWSLIFLLIGVPFEFLFVMRKIGIKNPTRIAWAVSIPAILFALFFLWVGPFLAEGIANGRMDFPTGLFLFPIQLFALLGVICGVIAGIKGRAT